MAKRSSPFLFSAISLGIVVVCFGVAEAVLRACGYPKEQGPPALENALLVPSREYGWEAKPNFNGVFANAVVRVNAAGIRADREYEVAAPPGTYRVATLGNSCAFGYGVTVEECFSSQLEKMLAADLVDQGPRVEVLNFGTPGHSSVQGLARWREQVRAYRPDFVVLSYGWNNAGRFDILPDHRRLHEHSAACFLRDLHLTRALRLELKRLSGKALGERLRVGRRVPPDEFVESVHAIVDAARRDHAPAVLLLLPRREQLVPGGTGENASAFLGTGEIARAAELLVLPPERRTLAEWRRIIEPIASSALPICPPDAAALRSCREAIAAAESGDAEHARALLEREWARGEANATALYDLAVLHERLGERAAADSLFDLLLDRTKSAVFQYQTYTYRIARETGAPVLDFLWEFQRQEDPELFIDPGHPNGAGHTVIARAIAEVVEAEIRRGRDPFQVAQTRRGGR